MSLVTITYTKSSDGSDILQIIVRSIAATVYALLGIACQILGPWVGCTGGNCIEGIFTGGCYLFARHCRTESHVANGANNKRARS